MPDSPQPMVPFTIRFPSGSEARAVRAAPGATGAELLTALGLAQPQALLLVAGGAHGYTPRQQELLVHLLHRAARAARESGALLLDGGTGAGVMELLGQGAAAQEPRPPLLGVAPHDKVGYPGGPDAGAIEDGAPLDANHTHFVLADRPGWGGETPTMFALADAVTGQQLAEGTGPPSPAVLLLAGGGLIARDETLSAVRRGWPIVVVDGSGRVADEIARLGRERRRLERQRHSRPRRLLGRLTGAWDPELRIGDPALAEIVERGDIRIFGLRDDPARLHELLGRLLAPALPGSTVELAWDRFALFDYNADRQQRLFRRLRDSALAIGVVTTIVTLSATALQLLDPSYRLPLLGPALGEQVTGALRAFGASDWLRLLVIVLPLVMAGLLAADTRYSPGSKWIQLRAAAEDIKSAIFRYRARATVPPTPRGRAQSAETWLSRQVEEIGRRTLHSDASEAALRLPPGSHGHWRAEPDARDDGLTRLSPERYIQLRIIDQVGFFRDRVAQLARRRDRFRLWVIVYSGAGAFLAAAGAALWVPLTTAVTAALIGALEYLQVEQTIRQYNQAASDLENVLSWWSSLPPAERAEAQNIDTLVDTTELIRLSEGLGWVQQMRSSLTDPRRGSGLEQAQGAGPEPLPHSARDGQQANGAGAQEGLPVERREG